MFQLSHFHHFHQEPSRSRALCHTEESEDMVCDMVSQWPSGIGEKTPITEENQVSPFEALLCKLASA